MKALGEIRLIWTSSCAILQCSGPDTQHRAKQITVHSEVIVELMSLAEEVSALLMCITCLYYLLLSVD